MKQDRNFSMSGRSTSPQLKTQKTQKLNKNLYSQQSSSCKTNSKSQEKQPLQPKEKERKILNFIKELEVQQQKEIINQKLIHLYLKDAQILLPINEDQDYSELRRQLHYHQNYHQNFSSSMISEYVYLGYSLSNQQISYKLRAKMINWMIEVLGNYSETTSDATFFRSISIMDYYLKKTIFQYTDNQLHLIGITSMFIATKIEDIYQIPLQDFVTRICHNEYSISKIKEMEQSILETLNFEITFPTALDFLKNIFYQCFSLNDNPYLQNILDTSIYILKMCLHDYSMTSFNLYTLASSSLIYSITDFVNKNYLNNQQIIINQFQNKIVQIFQIDQIELNLCEKNLQDLIDTFQFKYPKLHNLRIFS
ncbi:unnamed protein product [Paramecium primaurelia]|uniref:Cyclin-like domain-containing protein n=1 Tax=Paramecium primaurelia TaxID=5886 RepID=A0A8S1MQ04_PARPR|nr:unnamed protein product [Paramecium primaurelia]